MSIAPRIGIIGYGNDQWVAGVLYVQSLLVGRYLLSQTNQDTILFLHSDFHDPKDYAGLSEMVESTNIFDYFYGSSFPITKRIILAVQRLIKSKWPLFPDNNLPDLLRDKRVDIVFPANTLMSRKYSSARLICWLPDFQERHLPANFTAWERAVRRIGQKKMLAKADKIILGNAVSYADACAIGPEFTHKFEVLPFTMHLGNEWRKQDPVAICLKYDINGDYLMFPSQFWKHKNHLNLFKAILLLKNRGRNIKLVSSGFLEDPRFPLHRKMLEDFILVNQLSDHIRILGLLPREDQIQLMRGARAIVQPSLFEGWSALLEDCRSLGKTVFASDIVMHREQNPDHAIFFDPHSPEQLASVIEQHWHTLPRGVDEERERIGEMKNIEGLKAFARKFNEICNAIQ